MFTVIVDLKCGIVIYSGQYWDINGFTRPGKRVHNELENHHPTAINGKTHVISMAILNGYVK